jgi:spore maturation protein CgeB
LLPAGLSQRIFDVWAAGGFCLTDWSAGLGIFPDELVEPVCFRAADELPELAARLKSDAALRESLRRAWQAHILTEHSYEKRLADALGKMK